MAIDWFEVKRTLERQIERDQSSHGERVARLANSVVALHEAEMQLARIGGDFVKGLIRFSGMHHQDWYRNRALLNGGASDV